MVSLREEATLARKKEADREERLQIMLAADELAAVDKWRFEKHMPSRAAAIRDLLRRGLADRGASTAAAGRKSSSYGVMKKETSK
jgi:metal-responsive CopG/Arc/MetJ family transcriptional regulator